VLDGFEKANPDVHVKYVSDGGQLPTLLAAEVQEGRPPDVAVLPDPRLLEQLARARALKPITFAAGAIAANYLPGWRRLGTVNGKLYGLFFKGVDKSTVWYNVGVFRNAGVKPPTTWDEFLALAPAIRKTGIPPYSIAGADPWTLTDLFENVYLRQAGAAKYDALSSHSIKWTDPTVENALRTMSIIFSDPSLIAGGTRGALATNFPTAVNQVFASPPRAAMVLEGDFVQGVIRASSNTRPQTGFGVFAFPSIGNSPPSIVGNADAVVMLKDSPAARALISYLATPQAAEIWARRGAFSSPNRKVPQSAYSTPSARATAAALANASVFRFDMSELQPPSFGATLGRGEFKLFDDFLRKPGAVVAIAAQLEAAAASAYAAKG
jgi:ABC-type glycerol-3-phosphate transport system substrate-binding protein